MHLHWRLDRVDDTALTNGEGVSAEMTLADQVYHIPVPSSNSSLTVIVANNAPADGGTLCYTWRFGNAPISKANPTCINADERASNVISLTGVGNTYLLFFSETSTAIPYNLTVLVSGMKTRPSTNICNETDARCLAAPWAGCRMRARTVYRSSYRYHRSDAR